MFKETHGNLGRGWSVRKGKACCFVWLVRKLFSAEPPTVSQLALQWLSWKSHKLARIIRNQFNSTEKRLGDRHLTVDGWDGETRTVYQFHGCYWHGHTCRLTEKYCGQEHPIKKVPFESLWLETKANEHYIESLDEVDRLVVMTECRWKDKVRTNAEIRQFVDSRFKRKLDGRNY